MSVSTGEEALQDAFRAAMAAVCTPVSVVTTLEGGLPYGTTVSAFTSLSLDPPMILVSLDRNSDLLAKVHRTGRFGLNVLASSQPELAMNFARKGGTAKFSGVRWREAGGVPLLPGVASFLACEVERHVDGGDHVVILGNVVYIETADGRPLTYHARAFGTHTVLASEAPKHGRPN
ncbi:flavin reductase family protein [Nonomuraea jabiensis]|uniref:flavin reductase family protein n=1 Tax=Nonomuraea jabiensis TaxID=882448 RepID=UPI0034490DC2